MNFLIRVAKLKLIFLLTLSSSLCYGLNDSNALSRFKILKQKNQSQLKEMDSRLLKTMKKLMALNITESTHARVSSEFQSLEKSVVNLKIQKREFLLRQDFYDRILFQMDNNYKSGPLKGFLITTVKKMALVETSKPFKDDSLWKFLNYLSIALKNLPERNEDLIAFLEGYVRFSSLSKPLRPDEYVNLRDYTNGSENYTAQTVSRQSVGDIAERQIEALKVETIKKKQAKVFELRQPTLKGVTQVVEPAQPTSLK